MGQVQGAGLLLRRGQEEPGQDDRPGLQAAVQDQDLQAADRGGRGDRRPQPGQVQEGPTGAGGGRGARQARCPSLIQGNGPGLKSSVEFGKKSEQNYWTRPCLRLQKLPVSELQNTSSLIVPHPLQLPPGRAPWFILMSVPAPSLKLLYSQIE